MVRPRSLLPALVGLLAAAGTLATAGPAPARPGPAVTAVTVERSAQVTRAAAPAPAETDEPLRVTIESMYPAHVPSSGRVQVSGTVTNLTDEEWLAVNVIPFVGRTPITSSTELAEQTALPIDEYVGERVAVAGSFDNVGDLAPGESAPYTFRVRSSLLGLTEPGVYWFGAHASGETASTVRDAVADGRARTFLPLVPEGTRRRPTPTLDTALVIPVRHAIDHREDGRIDHVRRWARDLEDGALRTLVDFGASAGSRPVTWLIDPAVVEAVRRLVAGNARRSIADTVEEPVEPGQTISPSPSTSAEPEPADPEPGAARENAATEPGAAWLDRLRAAVSGNQVLALPYGDVDVPAALERDPAIYREARRRSGTELQPWGFPTTPAVHGPSGFLDPAELGAIHPHDTVLVSDELLGGPQSPAVVRVGDRRLVVGSSAAHGGPAPGDPMSGIALRQQLLAESAVRLLEDDPRPLVVVLPQDWDPESTTGFFDALDAPWVDLTDVEGLDARAGGQVRPERLVYPESQVRRELDAANFIAAEALVRAGETLQNVLLRNDEVASLVRDQALTSLSYAAREDPDASRVAADRSRGWIFGKLGAIDVAAPPSVTLSSTTGRFSATVTNRLQHPVRVRVRAVTDEPMEIEGPDLIEIAAKSRTSVLLDARTDQLGVSNVRLVVTDEDGTPLGSTDTLPIRSAQVSRVIWLIMGVGVTLLFVAITIRLVRRVRRARAAT